MICYSLEPEVILISGFFYDLIRVCFGNCSEWVIRFRAKKYGIIGEGYDTMKSTWPLIIAAAVIISALIFLSSTGKKAPFIPLDNIHRSLTTQEECVTCHAPGKQAPLQTTHPPKEQCLICHTVNKS